MLTEIEGKGYFKYLALVSLTASMSSLDFIYMNLAFLIQKPVYQCKYTGSQDWTVCTEEEICGSSDGAPSFEWRINWDDEDSLHNWYEKLDLMCASSFKINVLLFAYFLGISVTVLWVPQFSDRRSRKLFVGGAIICDLFMYTILLFTTHYGLMVFILFMMGVTCPLRVQTGWVYLYELVSEKYQTFVGTAFGVCQANIYLFSTFFFWGAKNSGILVVGYIVMLLAAGTFWMLPDSPRLLAELGKIDEC